MAVSCEHGTFKNGNTCPWCSGRENPVPRSPGCSTATDQQIEEWAKRHDINLGSFADLRCAFEDAQTLCR